MYEYLLNHEDNIAMQLAAHIKFRSISECLVKILSLEHLFIDKDIPYLVHF